MQSVTHHKLGRRITPARLLDYVLAVRFFSSLCYFAPLLAHRSCIACAERYGLRRSDFTGILVFWNGREPRSAAEPLNEGDHLLRWICDSVTVTLQIIALPAHALWHAFPLRYAATL